MAEVKLTSKKRDITGRKVKIIRQQGQIPANLYGKQIKSQSLTLDKKEFEKVYDQVGETGLVTLSIEDDKNTRPIIIQNLQRHPVSDEILHVDLRQVILTEKIVAEIPVEMVGEAPATTQKLGILVQNTSEIEVEALPLDLPEKFVVDVSKLSNVGDQILVKELLIDDKKITLKTTEDLVVVKIEPLAKEEVAPPPVVPAEGETVAAAEGREQPEAETAQPEETGKEEKAKERKKE